MEITDLSLHDLIELSKQLDVMNDEYKKLAISAGYQETQLPNFNEFKTAVDKKLGRELIEGAKSGKLPIARSAESEVMTGGGDSENKD